MIPNSLFPEERGHILESSAVSPHFLLILQCPTSPGSATPAIFITGSIPNPRSYWEWCFGVDGFFCRFAAPHLYMAVTLMTILDISVDEFVRRRRNKSTRSPTPQIQVQDNNRKCYKRRNPVLCRSVRRIEVKESLEAHTPTTP